VIDFEISSLAGSNIRKEDHSSLAAVALQCVCTLLSEVPHFNFRVNLMTCVVARLSNRSLDQV
jgi:nucleolar complex protein 3